MSEAFHVYRIESTFTEIKLIDYALKKYHGVVRTSSFTDRIRYEVAIPASNVEPFLIDMETHGKHRILLEPMGLE